MSKVYGYCRVALANKEEMEEQLKMVEDYCKNNGLNLHKCFCDNGASGLSLDRKGLNGLLDVLQNGDVIVMKNMSRLSRGYSQCLALMERMKEMNVTLKVIY